jgi:thioredoxin-like negative regulator of GroEL
MNKGRPRAALANFVRVLEIHGPDATIHAKVATLHARLGQLAEAHGHFQAAAAEFMMAGFEEKALAVLRNAVTWFPTNVYFWEAMARLQCGRRCPAEAVKTLLEGRQMFIGSALRLQAVRLLEQVIHLEPTRFDAAFDLAVLLGKVGRAGEAAHMLAGLVERAHGVRLRRVRGALFRCSPTPAAAWRWVRAALLGR